MPTIGEVAVFLDARDSFLQFDDEAYGAEISGPADLSEAVSGDVAFCRAMSKGERQSVLGQTRASLLIIDRDVSFEKKKLETAKVRAIILTDNARLDFIRVVEKFFAPSRPQGIHHTTVISPLAQIASDVFVGPLCSVGHAEIDRRTVIHSGVHIYDGVKIGKDVVIHSGTVIGSEGFGYERNETKRDSWLNFLTSALLLFRMVFISEPTLALTVAHWVLPTLVRACGLTIWSTLHTTSASEKTRQSLQMQ